MLTRLTERAKPRVFQGGRGPNYGCAERMTGQVCEVCGEGHLVVIGSRQEWALAAARDPVRGRLVRLVREDSAYDFENLLRCPECGFAKVARMPTDGALLRFYERDPTHNPTRDKHEKRMARAGARLRRLKNKIAKTGRFLDVRCGAGPAVEAARLAGYEAWGIDSDPYVVARARHAHPNCRFETAYVEDFAHTGETFDVVYCADALGHAPNAVTFIQAIGELLKPGGTVFIALADAGHKSTPDNLLDWREVRPPEQLAWYTRDAVRSLLGRNGFDRIRFEMTFNAGLRVTARRARKQTKAARKAGKIDKATPNKDALKVAAL